MGLNPVGLGYLEPNDIMTQIHRETRTSEGTWERLPFTNQGQPPEKKSTLGTP